MTSVLMMTGNLSKVFPWHQIFLFCRRRAVKRRLNGPFHIRSLESPPIEALKMTVPLAPFHMCHDNHGEGRSMIPPVAAFGYVANDDVIPTRKRWMNPRMLGP